MIFSNPTYLWTLLGVLIPIAIHLWSRRKVVTIKVGSTKLLQASEPKRASSIRLNELWLLVLRILIISLVSFIISGPQLDKVSERMKIVYIIEPALLDYAGIDDVLTDVSPEAIRVLSEGFPAADNFDGTINSAIPPNYWQLAQKMQIVKADSIVVLVRGFSSGIKGKRPESPTNINWFLLNTDDISNQVVEVTRKKDSLELLRLSSDSNMLQLQKKKVSKNSSQVTYNELQDSLLVESGSVKIATNPFYTILIVHTDSLTREAQYIDKGYRALSKYLDLPIEIKVTKERDSVTNQRYDTSVWLGVQPSREIMGTQLILQPTPFADRLIIPGDKPQKYLLTATLNSENSVTEKLPEELYQLLSPYDDFEKEIRPYDKRVVSIDELRPKSSDKPLKRQEANLVDMATWLWPLLLLALVAERIISNYRQQ